MVPTISPAELGFAQDFSIGLALLDSTGESLLSLVSRADAAVYQAKQT